MYDFISVNILYVFLLFQQVESQIVLHIQKSSVEAL